MSSFPAGSKIFFRCEGNEQVGAGHVSRCLPLAAAFAGLGWKVSFVGAYEGLAHWLLIRAKVDLGPPDPDVPCGVVADDCDIVIVDSYAIESEAICELARELTVVTLAEANRCPTHGVLLDYHLDRLEASGARLLAGPSFAPLDPRFAGAGRSGEEVRKILVTAGGSLFGRRLIPEIVPMVNSIFPDTDIVLAGSAKSETIEAGSCRLIYPPSPSALVDLLADVDLAVSAAGLTAYELACAGVPQVTVAIAVNQRRVVEGLSKRGLALCLDLTSGDRLADLPPALRDLRDITVRRRLAERGMETFDGHGALRAAIALTELSRGVGG